MYAFCFKHNFDFFGFLFQDVPSVCVLPTSEDKQRQTTPSLPTIKGYRRLRACTRVKGPRASPRGNASEIQPGLEGTRKDQARAQVSAGASKQFLGADGKPPTSQDKIRVLQQDSQVRQGRQEGLRWPSLLSRPECASVLMCKRASVQALLHKQSS